MSEDRLLEFRCPECGQTLVQIHRAYDWELPGSLLKRPHIHGSWEYGSTDEPEMCYGIAKFEGDPWTLSS